jgi:hypothetical protein
MFQEIKYYFLLAMRRTRKNNKKFRKTRRGGGRGSLKLLPPLPESPQSSPQSSPKSLPNIKKPEIKVKNTNLVPVQKYTHTWYERQQPRITLLKAKELPLWKKLLGIKNKPLEAVPLNSEGYPIKSAFNINKNSGFKPK